LLEKVKVVYLDHFAAIEVSDNPSSEIWVEIRDLLLDLVRNGKLICPISFNTYVELTKSNFTVAKSRCKVLHSLSNGKSFNQEMILLYDIVNAIIKKNELNKNSYIADSNISFFQSVEDYESLKILRLNYEKFVNQNESEIEKSNKIRRIISSKNITLDYSVNTQEEIIKSEILTRLNELLEKGRLEIRESNLKEAGVDGHWVDQLLNYLVNRKNFKHEELVLFRNHLIKFGVTKIPPLDIKSKLFGLRVFKKLKGNTNDQIDIKRISTGLPASDFLLTDRQRKSEIIELGLDRKYDCKVFSGRQIDLELFRDELVNLKNTTHITLKKE
jgi:hypothetical protein